MFSLATYQITGRNGRGLFQGTSIDVSTQTDAVSRNPSDSMSGIQSASVTIPFVPNTAPLLGGLAILDGLESRHAGIIKSVSGTNNVTTTLTTEHALSSKFNKSVDLLPTNIRTAFAGTDLANVFKFTSGIPTTTVGRNVTSVVPAFSGNGWVYVRDFIQANDLLFDVIGTTVNIGDAREIPYWYYYLNEFKPMDVGITTQYGQHARKVEVNYTNAKYLTNKQLYPAPGEEPTIITVEAGERAIVELPTNASWASVKAATAVDYMTSDFQVAAQSMYVVSGTDGLPVSADGWRKAGGSVNLAIDPTDRSKIIVTITAPPVSKLKAPDGSTDRFAPYSLALADSTGTGAYNTLRISGTGTITDTKTLEVYTGAEENTELQDVGTTLDNIFVTTYEQAMDVGLRLARTFNGVEVSGQLTADLSMRNTITPGTRVRIDDAVHRVESVTENKVNISASFAPDTRMLEVDNVHAGMTMAQFDTRFAEYTFTDFDLQPLKEV